MKKSCLSIALVAVLVISGCSKPSTDTDNGGAESNANTQQQADKAVQDVNASDAGGVSDSGDQTSEPVAESAEAAKEDTPEKNDDSGQKKETSEPKEQKAEKPSSSS